MKTFILAVAAVFVMSTNAMAQDTNNTQNEHKRFSQTEMIQNQTNRMAEQLGLDETQKAAVLKLNTEYAGKMGPGFGRRGMGGPGPRGQRMEQNDSVKHERPSQAQMQEMMKQMEETRAAYNAELKKILTEEQYTKYETREKQMRERGFGGMNGGPRRHDNNQNMQMMQQTEE